MKYTVQVFGKAVYIERHQVGLCFRPNLKQVGLPEQTVMRWNIFQVGNSF